MSVSRCPKCAALLAPAANWCSLCFAEVAGADEPYAAEPDAAESGGTPAPPRSAVALLERPDVADEGPREPPWPCRSCGAQVAFAQMTCPTCGAPFLLDTTPAAGLLSRLPELSSGRRAVIMIGGATVLASLLLVVAFLLGLVV